ncbi:zinc-binding alcohol dehydrogenase [Saccharopolyspora rhizosphaerae]|uniref:Zinc-binding alcohol dehydrogenase n=1 Tax=Saccharopolyspora rhizosphaerae TaxID=2492662 RepID=A0A426JLZ5_9PSEU|nr:zinc-binding alcohol dehydrogenase [Saccharopolyspora rhizosphaerae]RRO14242.1 zinc-binding alcohol dehydrogenase [Saccharopolyspora rhizosphaerae]
MPRVVQFTGPRQVDVTAIPTETRAAGQVRVRTRYSGISAGTELTAYRGTNPYLTRTWDAERRLFTGTASAPTQPYPVVGWGYSEVGEVVEADDPARVSEQVWGIWGHRSEAVLPAEEVRRVPGGVHPLAAAFARVGAVALNAVLSAEVHLGERVAVFGQGVIGLLATRLLRCSGVEVVAVDTIAQRRDKALEFGAAHAVEGAGAAERVRELGGADVAIDLSGSYRALHEAIRTVVVGGRVVAAGFYQDEAVGLRLGEEFHHNRVELVSSQIGGVPPKLAGRWDQDRLTTTFLDQCARGAVDPTALVTHLLAPSDVERAYRLLDEGAPEVLQIVLDFEQE